MKNLNNKVALITGSSMGIGKTLAYELAKRGTRIVLNARNETRLQRTAQEMTAAGYDVTTIAGDVTKEADCQKMVDHAILHYGQLDILVNNAGVSVEGEIGTLEGAVCRKVFEVNYLGTIYCTQAALPHLKNSKGSVIFIGSVAGLRGLPNFSIYSSSKMALTALAESMRIEQAETGVHVGLAYVGFTRNDPEKTTYNADGKLVPQPKRDFIKAEEPEVVAQRIIGMIEYRTFKKVFSPLGKLNAVLSRMAPGVVHFVLGNNYRKQKWEEVS